MKTILRSRDLDCPTCVGKIETALRKLDGVQEAKVHFATGRIEVEHEPQRPSREELVDAVRSVGYEATVSAF